MKKIFYLSLLAGVLGVTSCDDMLDVTPQGSPVAGSFWANETDAISGINAVYAEYSNDDMYGRGFFWLSNGSDDIGTKPRAFSENVKAFKVTGNESETKNIWGLHYRTMKRCNDVLRNVPAINMDEKLKNRILGEAHFHHAVMHLELAYHYGDHRAGVPIIDRENPSDPYVRRPANVNVNYDYIAGDLKAAAELLPYFDEYKPSDYGRPHKTAAWAYLVRTYLYAGDWANAELYADMVIKSGKHDLLEKFSDVFSIANNFSPEYIWSVTSSAKDTGLGSIFPGVLLEDKGWGAYNGWGVFYPTQDLYEEYESGDERREATILKTGDKFAYFGDTVVFNQGKYVVSSSNRTGLQFRKFMEPFGYPKAGGSVDTRYVNTNADKPTTALNVPLIRYADVLLMSAEAKIKQGKSGDAEINEVRDRADLDPINGATLDDLKHERRCELAGEWTDRHFDLVRWGDAQSKYAQPLYHAFAKDDKGNPKVIYEGRTFNPTIHHVWPIPPDEIAVSKETLWQNQGW
ncbi:RagB/SusD family nutrient uptake outer membrane protein [Parachryseolinea silvisoli]|uniref:RagB/SusD family nutrient uptake outer membrane protein n=1 Tax=Parachryseolinea silvisoli TaxID=2873601 RepID=UPI0022659EFA|nr:RagB/SusD family nutrient uptake outer membrane protein [Parachryseolinea silvisoli]MCD9015288.1 RagB/SusD family nutrient uptake outer membrane protein [Parachryseolinea silvisoli]